MVERKYKICHVSSVHLALDTRIYYRYCLSLSKKYSVELIACHPKKEILNNVTITPYPRYKNRIFRVLFSWLLILPKTLASKARIYHLHDAELIPLGLILWIIGKKVIYDIHENIAEDIFDKDWIKYKRLWYTLYNFFEKPALKKFNIILAEDSYLKRYRGRCKNLIVLHNYCDISFFEPFQKSYTQRDPYKLFYIGILLENRGILEILEAMYIAKQKNHYFEFHVVAELYTQVSEAVTNLHFYNEIQDQVIFYGRKNLEDGYSISRKCGIGMCIIHPMSNSIESYPTKIFEYMAVGLPIVSSNFPLYNSVINKNECGITVNPKSAADIANAIIEIATNKELRSTMELKGKKAVLQQYSWQNELPHLTKFYSDILA